VFNRTAFIGKGNAFALRVFVRFSEAAQMHANFTVELLLGHQSAGADPARDSAQRACSLKKLPARTWPRGSPRSPSSSSSATATILFHELPTAVPQRASELDRLAIRGSPPNR
jgi:hypothetical protein